MVTNDERDYMYLAYSADPRTRINLGIRRRLAPLMDNNRRRIELLNSLLFSLPGTPIVYYGDEVGMWGANDPDNRQPMLWDDVEYVPERTTARGSARPVARKPDRKLFSFFRKAIAVRRGCAALRRGSLRWVKTNSPQMLAFCRDTDTSSVLVLLNAGDRTMRHRIQHAARDLWTGGRRVKPGEMAVQPRGWKILECLNEGRW